MHRNCNPCPTPLSSYTKTFKLRSLQLLTTTTYTFPKDLVEWGTTFRKYKTVAEHDHEPNKNNSTHFHSRARGQTLQPFPTLTLINNNKTNNMKNRKFENAVVVYKLSTTFVK